MIKLNLNNKIFFLIKIILIYFIFSLKSYSDNSDIKNNFVVLGINEAPIKIKVFSSFTCPHCAKFHIDVIPKIKKKYIESGVVQLIFIDFPLDKVAFNVSKLLHCLQKNYQLDFLDTIYETQRNWVTGSDENDINKNLKKIVKTLGINSIQFDKCLDNEVISDKILNGRIDASKKYSISSTPTIVINEKKLKGSTSFKDIEKYIENII